MLPPPNIQQSVQTPPRQKLKVNQNFISPSPLRNPIPVRDSSKLECGISLLLSDLSNSDHSKLVDEPNFASFKKVSTVAVTPPSVPFDLNPASVEAQEKSLLNLSQDSSLDVQALLDKDLGIFAGMDDI